MNNIYINDNNKKCHQKVALFCWKVYNSSILSRQKRKKVLFIPNYNETMNDSFLKNYLKDIKKHILNDNYTMARRDKNIAFMKEYGLDFTDLREVILDLSPSNCISKCEADRDGKPGFIYKFKSDYVEDLIIYIKTRYNPPDEVVVISFHEDEI